MSTQEPEQVWATLLDEARRLIDVRDTAAARVVLRQAIEYSDKTWGKDDGHLIRPLRMMAESFWRERQPLDATNGDIVECFERALAIARSRLPANHVEVAMLAGELGSHLVIGGRIDEGCALMTECVDIARKNGDEHDFVRYLSGLGNARMEQGRPAEALPWFERAAAAREQRDAASGAHAIARYHLGTCLLSLGRTSDASAQLELALRIVDATRRQGSHARLMNDIMEALDLANRKS